VTASRGADRGSTAAPRTLQHSAPEGSLVVVNERCARRAPERSLEHHGELFWNGRHSGQRFAAARGPPGSASDNVVRAVGAFEASFDPSVSTGCGRLGPRRG
jgi:hypothetical protein